jgi:hypothetical protein
MANATELTVAVAKLEERVANHIKFFWVVVSFGFIWLSAITVFLVHINETASRIEKAQGILEQKSTIRQDLTTYASLPSNEFKATLPELSSAIAAAKRDNVKVAPQVIGDLQHQLTGAEGTPEFWHAAGEFVSYKSFNTTVLTLPANMKRCVDAPPSPSTVKEVLNDTQLTINPGVYENCQLTLDSAQEDTLLNSYLLGGTPSITFKHCLIVYRGGPINLIIAFDNYEPKRYTIGGKTLPGTVKVSGSAIQFLDCLFDLELNGAPPEPGRRLTQSLLTNNTSSIAFTSSAPS